MTSFTAEARIALPDGPALVAAVCEHLVGHGAAIEHAEDATLISLDGASARLSLAGGEILVRAEAPDLAALQGVKRAVASHIVEFAAGGQAPAMRWTGDGSAPALPPDFRVMTVAAVADLTPHMRRISFSGHDLARFARLDALHVRLFLPPPGLAEPEWPMIGGDGLVMQPPPERRPVMRKYTIRTIDAAAGTLAIDFVLHDDAGPGAAFAARARPGDRIGMAGPGGRGLQPADRHLFLADETALPAVARMLAALPPTAHGLALLEVADAAEIQPLAAPTGLELRWLLRDGAEPGTTALLPDAFAALPWLGRGEPLFLWAAMEHGAFRSVRATARERLRPVDRHLIVSYWRRGVSEERFAEEKRAARGG